MECQNFKNVTFVSYPDFNIIVILWIYVSNISAQTRILNLGSHLRSEENFFSISIYGLYSTLTQN